MIITTLIKLLFKPLLSLCVVLKNDSDINRLLLYVVTALDIITTVVYKPHLKKAMMFAESDHPLKSRSY